MRLQRERASIVVSGERTRSGALPAACGRSVPAMHLAAGLLVGASLVSGVLLPPAADSSIPGITAVLLNWARLANVVRIVDNLCSPRVQDIVRSVVVWNNNPGLHLTRHVRLLVSGCLAHGAHDDPALCSLSLFAGQT